MSENEISPEQAASNSEISNDKLEIGTVLDNRYEVLGVAGEGASSVVYKVNDRLMTRVLALKLVHKNFLDDSNTIERFALEGQVNSVLDHPGICRTYVQKYDVSGRPYQVMDFLEGESLAAKLERDGKLTGSEFRQVFMQLADALAVAHSKGLIHRDVKPGNIILTIDENSELKPVLIDFGLSKWIDNSANQKLTATGIILGSCNYMSPEQCSGAALDARSDIYSLGIVMLESLTGKVPFEGVSSFEVMYQHANDKNRIPSMLEQLPPKPASLLASCLDRDPAKRIASAEQVGLQLKSLKDAELDLNQAKKSDPRKKLMLPALLLVLLVLCLISFSPLGEKVQAILRPTQKKKLFIATTSERFIQQMRNSSNEDALKLARLWLDDKESQGSSQITKTAIYSAIALLAAHLNESKLFWEVANKFNSSNISKDNANDFLSACVIHFAKVGNEKEGVAFFEKLAQDEKMDAAVRANILYNEADFLRKIGKYSKSIELADEALNLLKSANYPIGDAIVDWKKIKLQALYSNGEFSRLRAEVKSLNSEIMKLEFDDEWQYHNVTANLHWNLAKILEGAGDLRLASENFAACKSLCKKVPNAELEKKCDDEITQIRMKLANEQNGLSEHGNNAKTARSKNQAHSQSKTDGGLSN